LVRTELGADCVVVMGVSLGALTAIPATALEEEVDGAILMMGAAGLPWIAQHSAEPAIRSLAGALDNSAAFLSDLALVDPLTWAKRIDPNRVLLVRALWDSVVPEPASRALGRALGHPREKVYPAGHHSFGFFLPLALTVAIDEGNRWCKVRKDGSGGDSQDG
jgi:pimeloyl-ACP methyl ester carboxylesterase